MFDVTTLGPGLWFRIHIDSINVKDKKSLDEYKKTWEFTKTFIICSYCKNDIIKLLDKNPIPEIFNNEETFAHSWKIHNLVNYKLGKNQMSYENARNFWFNLHDRMINPFIQTVIRDGVAAKWIN